MRLRRLVWIVTLDAIGGGKWLPLVCLDEGCILGIVTIKAEGRSALGQVIVELDLSLLADLMGDVASLATHIQRCVTAALVGDVQPLLVAGEAQIFACAAGSWLQQLVLVGCRVRVMTLEAVADRWRMDRALKISGILIGVTGEAQGVRCRGDELYARDVFCHADFVAACASGGNGRVDRFALGFVPVTLNALG